MRTDTWGTGVVVLVVVAAFHGVAKWGESPRPVGVDASPPVVAVRGEAARDAKERETAVRRALAKAAALIEAREPGARKGSEHDTKPESVEVRLVGPAGGVRLSVRGQLPSGFVYSRRGGAGVDGALCRGAAALSAVPKGARPTLDSEAQP